MDLDSIINSLDFNSEDLITVEDVVSRRNEALENYVELCKTYSTVENATLKQDLDTFDISGSLELLNLINVLDKSIDSFNSLPSSSQELVSENYVQEYVQEHIENNFPEISEYIDSTYDWPGSYVEFDVHAAIQEKVDEAEQVILGTTTFYVITFW